MRVYLSNACQKSPNFIVGLHCPREGYQDRLSVDYLDKTGNGYLSDHIWSLITPDDDQVLIRG